MRPRFCVSYGKEGDDLAKATQGLIDLVNTVRVGQHAGPRLSIYTTEHASKTASSWNLATSSSDDYFEASRLACQLLWMGSYGLEQCACCVCLRVCAARVAAALTPACSPCADIFKFSSTPSNNGGIVKSGLHWGENSVRPYPVGDTTASGEAARMVISRMLGPDKKGRKTMLNCTTTSAYRPCALIQDGDIVHLVLVNDGVITATSGGGKGIALQVSVSLKSLLALDLQAGSLGARGRCGRLHTRTG